MLFSCKISNAVLLHLERQSEDLDRLERVLSEKLELPPIEFLKDPSCWLKSKQMEDFLEHVATHYQAKSEDSGLLTLVGHNSKELRAWGVLDSVLRMLQSPQDVFLQPQRFLSYFISPPPPVAIVKRDESSVILDLPIAADEFPRVVEYLKSAIESLPSYLGQSLAQVTWQESRLSIEWCTRQANLLEETEAEKALNPDLVQNILRDLEHSQKQIEELQVSLHSKNEEVKLLRQGTAPGSLTPPAPEAQPVFKTKQFLGEVPNVPLADLQKSLQTMYRLADYMSRSQQLVTMLVGQNRSTPQVKEAMRRVDWEVVQKSSLDHFKEVITQLQTLDSFIKNTPKANVISLENNSEQTHWPLELTPNL